MQILLPVTLISMLLGGVIGYALNSKTSAQVTTAAVPEIKATPPAQVSQPTPSDEASVANPSWRRWHPLTDF